MTDQRAAWREIAQKHRKTRYKRADDVMGGVVLNCWLEEDVLAAIAEAVADAERKLEEIMEEAKASVNIWNEKLIERILSIARGEK